jgi:hypothetical protein
MGAYIQYLKNCWNDSKIQAEELKKKKIFKKKEVKGEEKNEKN